METDYHLGANDGCKSPSWRERFVSYLDNSPSVVSRMVEQGCAEGLVDGNSDDQRLLACDLGAVLDVVYDRTTGGEAFIDDFSSEEILDKTGILPERQQGLISLMVRAGMVKSRVALEARRRLLVR